MLLQAANLLRVDSPSNNNDQDHDSDLPEHRRTVHALQGINRFFARVYHRLDVLTPCRLPEKGAAILICNHTSPLDPQLIQAVCPRLIRWMMAAEYADIWGVR